MTEVCFIVGYGLSQDEWKFSKIVNLASSK